ncbi:MiaB/RimO family radical SAM methylthiotransferase [Patescibacteria group bacterium]|nr:MiaB/RimO family radical SAM methylthiotransferase [Patescibacteria group bacterium]
MTQKKRYFIQVFGCQMNEEEAQQLAALYEQKGWQRASVWQEADELIIYSCSVREAAENRVHGLVDNVYRHKQSQKVSKPKVILTGCMVGSALGERKRYTLPQLRVKLPHVDEFRPWSAWGDEKVDFTRTQKDTIKALVPIMKGCNHFCTYCVVPFAKGKEVSLPFEEIICQVESLAEKGWEEFVLLGQNVNSFGNDFPEAEKNRLRNKKTTKKEVKNIFALFLQTIHQISGVKKISFITSNPWDLTDEIIETMKLPKIDRYFHLAVQSGDDEVLKKMNRGYTVAEFLKLVAKLRQAVPKIQIGTDIIVGFPGETKEAFENTVKLCKKIGFEKVYVSKYSVRPGTSASRMKDNVPFPEKQRRWRVIDKLVNR